MRKILLALTAIILFSAPNFASAQFGNNATNESPIFVMLKFSDDTRYDKLQSAERLSDFLVERLVNSGKFNIYEANTEWMEENPETHEKIMHESKWSNVNLEELLYNEKNTELAQFNAAIESDDYNNFFEGKYFDEEIPPENLAQSVAIAQQGQIIMPEVVARISEANNNARYLIQGTIINLGTGSWLADDLDFIAGTVSSLAQMASSQAGGILGNSFGGALSSVGNVAVTVQGIGIQCDVRIIDALDGKVIWCKRFKGVGQSKLINSAFFNFGHSKMSSNLYTKAMEKVAQKIADSLIEDMQSGKLFLGE